MPQGVVLGSVLYHIYKCGIPVLEQNTIATFADETASLAVGDTSGEEIDKLQASLIRIHT